MNDRTSYEDWLKTAALARRVRKAALVRLHFMGALRWHRAAREADRRAGELLDDDARPGRLLDDVKRETDG